MTNRLLGLAPLLLVALSACGENGDLTPLRVQAANLPPTVTTFTASTVSGSAPLDTTFTMQAADPDGDAFTCVLDTNGDGYGDLNYGQCTDPKTQPYTFRTAGTTNVKLIVTDARGASTVSTLPITVSGAGTPPPAPPTTPPASAAFDVTYRVDSDWKSGFVATVTIKNNGPAVNGWTLGWSFPGAQKITGSWNGTQTQDGRAVQVVNAAYNGAIPTGGTVSFGFLADYPYGTANVNPTEFMINGVKVGEPAPPPPPPPPPLPAPDGQTWVMGYYVGYHRDMYPLDAVNWAAMTHVMLGRVLPTPDGHVNDSFDIDPINGPIWAKSVVERAHYHNRKVILMLGGAGAHGDFVNATRPEVRSRFVGELITLLDRYGADGLDIDWEPITAEDQAPLRALVEDLRARRPGLILTLPVGWANANFPEWTATPFIRDIAPLLDRINIMSYSMNGVYSGWQAWHSSALSGHTANTPSSVESSVNAYANIGVPLSKLGIGIGFYGSCFRGVTQPRTTSSTMALVADDNAMSYANIMNQYHSASVRFWDDQARVPYLSSASGLGPLGCTFVSYEDPQSIALKGEYVRQRGLGGAILWNINEGYLSGAPEGQRDPLMDAVKRAFLP